MKDLFDVIVIGGGPAGSSAALILGRSRLSVLMIDNARPRNIRTNAVHGLLTRNNIRPLELRRIAHKEVLQVGVAIEIGEVIHLNCVENGFDMRLSDGRTFQAKRVVLATGLRDQLPAIDGLERLYGTSVFHCPFCDGWEARDKPLGVLGSGSKGVNIARGLLTWSGDVILFTNGTPLRREDRDRADEGGIIVRTEKIAHLAGAKRLEAVKLISGESIPRHTLFFDPEPVQQCGLAISLGCTTSRSGAVRTDKRQRTNVPALYVTGDAAADPNMVVVAMADGVKAALNIVQEMQREGHWLPQK
jgi:thioredoxin reductase